MSNRRKSPTIEGDGGKRTRITVSVPTALVDMIPAEENRSALVTELIEASAGRWGSVSQIQIRALRKKKAIDMFRKEANNMGLAIANQAAAEDTKSISLLIVEIDKRITGLEDIQRQLETIKDNLVQAKRERYDQVKGHVRVALKEALTELDLIEDDSFPVMPIKAPAKENMPARVGQVASPDTESPHQAALTPPESLQRPTLVATPSAISPDRLPTKVDEEVQIMPGLKFTRTK